MLQNNLSPTGLSRGISFLLPSAHQGTPLLYLPRTHIVRLTPWLPDRLPCRSNRTLDAIRSYFSSLYLPMLSSFLLSFRPRSPRLSALSVLLFYCGLPCCCLVSSVPSDLRLFRYLITYASLLTAHCCAYCGRYSPIGSRTLEPALIPLWTPLRSSNHTIYTVPLSVTSL